MNQKTVFLVQCFLFLLFGYQTKAEEAVTVEDIRNVRSTWLPLAQDLQATGILVLKTFLDRYNYYDFFTAFRDHPRETITENEFFRYHSWMVAKTIDEMISLLDQPDRLAEVLSDLGRKHTEKNIQKVHFQNLQTVIMDILHQQLNLTPEQLGSWDRVLTLAISLFFPN